MSFCPNAAVFAALLMLGGCTVGPDYHKPAPVAAQPVPTAFTVDGVTWKTAEPAAQFPRGQWWAVFADADLDRLESLAAGQNQDLAGRVAALAQARALVGEARSQYFPQLSVDPSFARQRSSFNAPTKGLATGAAYTYNLYALPATLSWEVDLFGRVRRLTEGARARMAAAEDDVQAVTLLLQAEIAQDYFTLRALDAEVKLLADTAQTFQRSLDLTENRRKGGIATELDVAQAQTQLRTTEAQIPALRLQRAQVLHAMAVLCGQPPMTFDLTTIEGQRAAEVLMPAAVPSELLERRPDIAAAERRVAAANADVGVATAAFYPRLVFSAQAGLQSVGAGTLFDWPSRLWSLGPTVDLPIFTGGFNKAQWAAARAAYDASVAAYRQSVLTAFQDVEDQLAAQELLQEQLQGEDSALQSARQTLEIANNRYKAGLVTYLDVVTSQSDELALQRTVVQLQGERRVAAVGLIKALGGSWK
ncbi:MAG TPA: efflux transporter outer membrane subunit [Verrucomicrobiae bacterium]|nr:efflux transporter outer membrane subunit [Verrucomicrobiae bacterium]